MTSGFLLLTGGALAQVGKFAANVTLVGPVKSVPNQKGKLSGTASGGKVKGRLVDLTQEHGSFCKKGYNERLSAHKV